MNKEILALKHDYEILKSLKKELEDLYEANTFLDLDTESEVGDVLIEAYETALKQIEETPILRLNLESGSYVSDTHYYKLEEGATENNIDISAILEEDFVTSEGTANDEYRTYTLEEIKENLLDEEDLLYMDLGLYIDPISNIEIIEFIELFDIIDISF